MRRSSYIKFFVGLLMLIAVIIIILTPNQYNSVVAAKKTADANPPTAPQKLFAVSITQTSISLKWSASFDKAGVASYLIYENSTYISSANSTSYTVTGLTASTSYTFYVKAKDYSGNISASSNIIMVKTTASAVPTITPTAAPTPAAASTAAPTPAIAPTAAPIAEPATPRASKIMAGYYANWSAYSGYTPLDIPASKLTNVNYAFAKIGDDLKIALADSAVDLSNFTQLNELKKAYPHLITSISIGGWDYSGKFSDAALTDASRTAFADSVIAFIKKYHFDGVDLDWEYPVSGGLSTNVKRPPDKTNFTLLLKKLRDKLNTQSAIDGKKYYLSFAGGAGSTYVNNTELRLIGNYVDYATIMTYDIHGSWDTYTDFNAPLYTPAEDSPQYKISVDSTVRAWISSGFPASKLVLGVPFYGHIYNGAANSNNGLYNTFTSSGAIAYDKVVSNYLNNSSFTSYYNAKAKVPWLYNGSVFISYDDADSIAAKAGYVKSNNLAGACAWELSQNKNGVLLNALYANLK